METQSKVWYVTGASEGLGLNLVKQLLAAGHKVAATSKNAADLRNSLGPATLNFLPLELNLSSENSIDASLRATAARFGKVDFIVNNPDCPLEISFDQLSDKQARAVFETNIFGMMNVIRIGMPYLRKNGAGHIFNVSAAVSGNGGYHGFSINSATKFAVAGVSESLAGEAKPFGIHVTVVLPCSFSTVLEQHNDPAKIAALMIHKASEENPPLYLVPGRHANGDAIYRKDKWPV